MALPFKSLYRRSVLQPSDVPELEQCEVLLSRKEVMREKTEQNEGREGVELEISPEDGRKRFIDRNVCSA